MTINRYIVEGVLRDIRKARRVLVVLAGPLRLEIPRLWDIVDQLRRDDPKLFEPDPEQLMRRGDARVTLRKAHGQESISMGAGEARFITARMLDRARGWEWDVLVNPDVNFEEEQLARLLPGMASSQLREVIR